jgi:hypothetical protein
MSDESEVRPEGFYSVVLGQNRPEISKWANPFKEGRDGSRAKVITEVLDWRDCASSGTSWFRGCYVLFGGYPPIEGDAESTQTLPF